MRMRIATPACGLVRNDMDFVTIRIKLGAKSAFFSVIARRDATHPDVAIRFPYGISNSRDRLPDGPAVCSFRRRKIFG